MTGEEIAELWRMHGPRSVMGANPGTKVHDFALALIAVERERCAKLCEQRADYAANIVCDEAERRAAQECANVIRVISQ